METISHLPGRNTGIRRERKQKLEKNDALHFFDLEKVLDALFLTPVDKKSPFLKRWDELLKET